MSAECPERFDARCTRDGDVQQQQIRLQIEGDSHRLRSGRRLADDDEVRFTSEQASIRSNQRVMVGHHDPHMLLEV